MSRKAVGSDWIKFSVHVVSRYKLPSTSDVDVASSANFRLRPPPHPRRHRSSTGSAYQTETVWVQTADLTCGCPRLVVRQAYLMAVAEGGITEERQWAEPGTGSSHRRRTVVLGRDSVAMTWRDEWATRLKQFARDEQRGKC